MISLAQLQTVPFGETLTQEDADYINRFNCSDADKMRHAEISAYEKNTPDPAQGEYEKECEALEDEKMYAAEAADHAAFCRDAYGS